MWCILICQRFWGWQGQIVRWEGEVYRKAAKSSAKTTHKNAIDLSFSSFKIQTALRHKSEIEHHRNKIRLRAKRKGHYEFPVVDDVVVVDSKEQHRIYRKAQMQIDKILDPGGSVPTVFIEPRKR